MSANEDVATFPIAVLSGSGGGAADLRAFAATDADRQRLVAIRYPGWKRYVAEDFSAEMLIDELAEDISRLAAGGRIGVVGNSLGGHLGYALALRLRDMGVEVAGFCAVDSFMISGADVRPGWASRHLAAALRLLRDGSFEKMSIFARSLFWRALMRLAGARAPALLRRYRDHGGAIAALALDPIFEVEVSMRLLMRGIAPWLETLDRNPTPLAIPSILIRTPLTRGDDSAWRRRCPNIQIVEVPGNHEVLFEAENIDVLRQAFLGASRGWR